MEIYTSTPQQPVDPGAKKIWVQPDLVVLTIKDNTEGGVLINDDGVSFSS
jgi:hypothetical protein